MILKYLMRNLPEELIILLNTDFNFIFVDFELNEPIGVSEGLVIYMPLFCLTFLWDHEPGSMTAF